MTTNDTTKRNGGGPYFSMPEVIKLATTLLTIAAMWWQLRSDFQVMLTKMDFQSRDVATLQETVARQQETINDIKLSLAQAGLYKGTLTITTPTASTNAHQGVQ